MREEWDSAAMNLSKGVTVVDMDVRNTYNNLPMSKMASQNMNGVPHLQTFFNGRSWVYNGARDSRSIQNWVKAIQNLKSRI